MLRTEDWQAALTAQKEMFLALDQVVELTGELEEAMLRRDAISSRLFLNMRKEQFAQGSWLAAGKISAYWW